MPVRKVTTWEDLVPFFFLIPVLSFAEVVGKSWQNVLDDRKKTSLSLWKTSVIVETVLVLGVWMTS